MVTESSKQSLANSVDYFLNLYKSRKTTETKFSSFVRNKMGTTMKDVVLGWDNVLTGANNKNPEDATVLDYNNAYENENNFVFQSKDNNFLTMGVLDNSINFDTEKSEVLGILDPNNVNGTDFDQLILEDGDFRMVEYTLVTDDRDAITNDNKFEQEFINVTTIEGKTRLKEVIAEYKGKYGDPESLKDVFGTEDGSAENVSFSADGKSMVVVAEGSAYKITADEDGIKSKNLTQSDAAAMAGTSSDAIVDNSASFSLDEEGKLNVTYVEKGTAGTTKQAEASGWGDPHYAYIDKDGVAQMAFDHQGHGEGYYTTLKGDDMSISTRYSEFRFSDGDATVMGGQLITMNSVNGVVKAEIDNAGNISINNPDGSKQIVENDYNQNGISIAKNSNKISIGFKDRELEINVAQLGDQKYLEITKTTTKEGDTGLLTQTEGAYLERINENDFTDKNQLLVGSTISEMSAPIVLTKGEELTKVAEEFVDNSLVSHGYFVGVFSGMFEGSSEISSPADVRLEVQTVDSKAVRYAKETMKTMLEYGVDKSKRDEAITKVAKMIELSQKAMLDDLHSIENSGKPIAERFQEGHGYSRSQWNEFLGSIAYTESVDLDKDGDLDKALDINNDKFADGIDVNNDGILSEEELYLYNLGEFFNTKKSKSIMF